MGSGKSSLWEFLGPPPETTMDHAYVAQHAYEHSCEEE
jgi:hypothetical protein